MGTRSVSVWGGNGEDVDRARDDPVGHLSAGVHLERCEGNEGEIPMLVADRQWVETGIWLQKTK